MDLTDLRLPHQRPPRPQNRSVASLVAWFGAVQAQEYGPAKWGLALRSPPGTTDAAIERAINLGKILRTHVLRPTWHLLPPADIRWMLELTGPRIQRTMAGYDRRLGLGAEVMTRKTPLPRRPPRHKRGPSP